MSRKIAIKEYGQGQAVLFPESMDAYIPANSPVRLINTIINQLDISFVMDTYEGGGCGCYHLRMLLKVLFYGYLNNIYSCRKIAKAWKKIFIICGCRPSNFPNTTPSTIFVHYI